MAAFVIVATLLLASTCSASLYGALSSQYHNQDHIGQYSYGYADPNSQKHESRAANGVTHGGYSYVDGSGLLQSVSYTADPHNGFRAVGTNLPKAQAPVAPVITVAHPAPYVHAYASPWAHAVAPVHITSAGVPADTPEVAAAKAAHFAAHAAAAHGAHHLHKRSLWGGHGYAAPWAYAPAPVIHNGVPIDTPEVQHAKAAHFAAHSAAAATAHVAPYVGHYGGAPLETPEVQHAKAVHFAAHAAARAGHPGVGVHHGPIHIPVIQNGVPVDTPEVQHAKAAHFAAVAEASARTYSAPDHHAYAPAHQGPIHIPVIHNGVPVETPAVQHAKAAHFAAFAEAKSRSSYGDGQYNHHGW